MGGITEDPYFPIIWKLKCLLTAERDLAFYLVGVKKWIKFLVIQAIQSTFRFIFRGDG